MKFPPLVVSILLFITGFCALVYQTVWLREFRMIFGGSTAASAAVLAIFMGGIGIGSLILGKKTDGKRNPLRFYGKLEMLIAGITIFTPALLWLAEFVYLKAGGITALGAVGGTLLRAGLAVLVLGGPTLLMGGTLPAAARAVVTRSDGGRRHLALLYGSNTLGAVLGVLLSTFFLLEHLGNRQTLWLACLLNLLAGFAALRLAKGPHFARERHRSRQEGEPLRKGRPAPAPLILVAAGAAGFVFLLMELVWYRMLGPLLGGTTFTLGLILATALLGIGIGSIVYAATHKDRPARMRHLAFTFALEGLLLAVPYALGDQIAVLALLLQPLGTFGFAGKVVGWSVTAALLIFPAAMVSGFQFPLLIALLGQGRQDLGRHTGLGYASNTLGAILGALAGGFGFLPFFTAPGTWVLAVALLLLLSLCFAIAARKLERSPRPFPFSIPVALVAIPLLLATGPTAVWRQLPIGAGLQPLPLGVTPNSERDWFNAVRRSLLHEMDGRESCIGITANQAISFVVNGKTDGNARQDASTQVMSGLLGALLHPAPRQALVIGLGTGSTAGWLGALPEIEEVDVMELEPAVKTAAELCAPVNRNALQNPKVKIAIGDARELLLTSTRQYDIVFSEPSNPYRAGVSSLFTREYYEAVRGRLRNGGLFIQWTQGYDIDAQAVQSIYATLHAVFGHVETWQTNEADMLFIASAQPLPYRVEAMKERIAQSPYREALAWAWRVSDLEGVMAHYVANSAFADAAAALGTINTDDRNLLEFAFARSVGAGSGKGFHLKTLRELARGRGGDRPETMEGEVDWAAVDTRRLSQMLLQGIAPNPALESDPKNRERAQALAYYIQGRPQLALGTWLAEGFEPQDISEIAMAAEILAFEGKSEALPLLDRLKETHPAESSLILGSLRLRQGRLVEATSAMEAGFLLCRKDPWASLPILTRSFQVAQELAVTTRDPDVSARLYAALKEPFSVYLNNEERLKCLVRMAHIHDGDHPSSLTLEAIELLEPHIPWTSDFLALRNRCYDALKPERADEALEDLRSFYRNEPRAFLLP